MLLEATPTMMPRQSAAALRHHHPIEIPVLPISRLLALVVREEAAVLVSVELVPRQSRVGGQTHSTVCECMYTCTCRVHKEGVRNCN